MKRVRVILAAHGEAESSSFLETFRVSHTTLSHAAEVMRLPAPLRLALCTAGALRKHVRGGPGSPHNLNTRRQAAALQRLLGDADEADYRVQEAFASAPPYLEHEVRAFDNADLQIVLSMIPTDSRLSCGLVCHPLHTAQGPAPERWTVLARLWSNTEFIALQCAHVAEHFPRDATAGVACLVLVMHGTVVRDERGQTPAFHTGQEEKAAYGNALRDALMAVPERPWRRVEIAYLNHGVGGEWSSPTLPELLARLAEEGVDAVTTYACEHLVDGGETAGLPALLAASPVAETSHLPSLNAATPFIAFLAARVRAATMAAGKHETCDHCPLQSPTTGRSTSPSDTSIR